MSTGKRADALGPSLAWISHPVSVGGLILLLLNDHVLKPAWPGPVTGKLSDIAGMLMFPPLIAVLSSIFFSRVRAKAHAIHAVLATGVLFAAVKAFDPAAEFASHVWSVVNGPSVVLADRTDLLVLPFLALSWAMWRHGAARPVTERRSRLIRMLVLVPVGLLATTATSARHYESVTWVGEVDGQMAVGDDIFSNDFEDAVVMIAVSEDGHTFTRAPSGLVRQRGTERHTQACSGRHCYRIVAGELHVQESLDDGATWTTAWQVAGWQYQALATDTPDLDDPQTDLVSRAIAVFEADGGHVVLVANARDGVLRRDVSGRWERLGIPDGQPIPLRTVPDFTWQRFMAATLAVLAVAMTGLGILRLMRRRVRMPRPLVLTSLVAVPVVFLFDVCAMASQAPSMVFRLIWSAVNLAAIAVCGAVAVALYRLGSRVALIALLPVAAVTAWFAQDVYRADPAKSVDFLVFRAGGGLIEAVQGAASLLPVAIGMAVAGIVSVTFTYRGRRAKPAA